MKTSQSFSLIGDVQFRANLMLLKAAAAKKIMRPAIGAGLRPIRDEARSKASPGEVLSEEASGLMKKAIKAKTSGKGENIVGKVYVDKSVEGEINGKRHVPGNVAHLVEFGHGGPHPAPPHPFMRPALDEKKSEALAAVESTARVKLDEVVLKMGVKALK